MKADAYREAGVDIEAGDRLVDKIKPLAKATTRAEVLDGIGGFGGLCALPTGYDNPVLVSGTDGVGTKLLVAQQLNRHETIGIDLVAMCVNDIVTLGAEPLFFLDYFATGKLDVAAAADVIRGIASGCSESGCALLGGETAEMPGMYSAGHYDLAGFAVGVVERDKIKHGRDIAVGDKLIGIASAGLHSNGFSLVRKVFADHDLGVDPGGLGCTLAEAMLEPTRLYVKAMLSIRDDFKAAAHITGGGIVGNIPRVLPDGTGAIVNRSAWTEPPIFGLLRSVGGLGDDDMYTTFNCGLGMVIVVSPDKADLVAEKVGGSVIGEVVEGTGVALR